MRLKPWIRVPFGFLDRALHCVRTAALYGFCQILLSRWETHNRRHIAEVVSRFNLARLPRPFTW